jgi:uncharacterized membrane protein YoaK (UPF0700 family)
MAWVAGGVDAIGYLALAHLFTAHMSGNSAAMGAHFGQLDWASALHRSFPIPLFVLGVALGAALVEIGRRRNLRSPFALIIGLEAALLLGFMLLGNGVMRAGQIRTTLWKFYTLAALPSLAMGLQNATLRRVAGHGVRTTYVSGMLTNFAEEGVAYLFWLGDHVNDPSLRRWGGLFRATWDHPAVQQMLLYGGIWTAFVTGAVIGGYAEQQWALYSAAFPLGGLLLILGVDLIQPLGAAARRETPAE